MFPSQDKVLTHISYKKWIWSKWMFYIYNEHNTITKSAHTVSHFSYAPLIKWKLLWNEISYFYSETTSVKLIYICISHWNFIVIKWETSGKMDLEGHYPQNTISHCIIRMKLRSHCTFFRVEFLQCQRLELIYYWQYLRLECVCQLYQFFKRFTILVTSWPRFEKSSFMTFFKVS